MILDSRVNIVKVKSSDEISKLYVTVCKGTLKSLWKMELKYELILVQKIVKFVYSVFLFFLFIIARGCMHLLERKSPQWGLPCCNPFSSIPPSCQSFGHISTHAYYVSQAVKAKIQTLIDM